MHQIPRADDGPCLQSQRNFRPVRCYGYVMSTHMTKCHYFSAPSCWIDNIPQAHFPYLLTLRSVTPAAWLTQEYDKTQTGVTEVTL